MANEQNASARFGQPDPTLDPTRGIPLYVQLANVFRYKIMSGAWPANYRFDKFETLAAQFKVARITVRQAVALLVQEGLLSTQRGRGTIVCEQTAGQDSKSARHAPGGQLAPAHDIEIKIVYKAKVDQLPPEFIADFGQFGSYVEISKVHIMQGIAFGMMRIFIAEEVFKRFPRRALEKSAALSLVFEYAPELSQDIRQVMTVEVADYILSEHLNYPFGSPVAKIMRHAYGEDRRLVYAGVSWYRGDRFEMEMTLPREQIQGMSRRRSEMAPRVRSTDLD